MRDRSKVMAAVVGGVNAYLEEEKRDEALSKAQGRRNSFTLNLWGIDGRQEMMQAKRIWQMRWFRK